jgi:aminoglycoside phosphotransferase (APT) family kinase protein
LLASGRDADIFEYGPGLVLRRSRDGRSVTGEAQTMEYLHAQGYPVPAVEEVSDDGHDLVMERIAGRSMVEAIEAAPWTVRRQAATLAELHVRLHEVAPPAFLPQAPIGAGTQIVHMDLHPLNVMIGPQGPVVIDWTNAALGDPLVDVTLAWVLMAAGQIPAHKLMALLVGWGRARLVHGFLAGFDRAALVSRLRDVVAWKARNPHMSEAEVAGMWRLVDQEEAAGA